MILNNKILSLTCLLTTSIGANATTYTWTGAVDGDWSNAANWDTNGVPVDSDAGGNLDLSSSDRIVFDSSTAPSSNVPSLGGQASGGPPRPNVTPIVDVIQGDVTLNLSGFQSGFVHNSGYSAFVGDGNTANGLASLTYNVGTSALNRDLDSDMAWTVYSDGSLIFDTPSTILAYGTDRGFEVTLAGGAFSVLGSVDLLRSSTAAGPSWFDFTDVGSTFTADFGADFGTVTDVEALIGAGLTFRSTTALTLGAVDNGNDTFTVQVVPEPSSFALLAGCFGLTWVMLRRRS